MDNFLRIAAIHVGTYALGPGYRAVIWIQGCPFQCKGCISPEWTLPGGQLLAVDQIAERIIENSAIQGITLSGGEPMTQAGPLSNLIRKVKNVRPDLDVICFTGYLYEMLIKKNDGDINEFLSQIDLLIDGPYIETLNAGIGLRGSSNQRFIHLSSRLSSYKFTDFPRKLEVFVDNGEAFIIGIPPRYFSNAWQNAMESVKQEINP